MVRNSSLLFQLTTLVVFSSNVFASTIITTSYDDLIAYNQLRMPKVLTTIDNMDKKGSCLEMGKLEEYTFLLNYDIQLKSKQNLFSKKTSKLSAKLNKNIQDNENFCTSDISPIFGFRKINKLKRKYTRAARYSLRLSRSLRRSELKSEDLKNDQSINANIYNLVNRASMLAYSLTVQNPDNAGLVRWKPAACKDIGHLEAITELIFIKSNNGTEAIELDAYHSLTDALKVIRVDVCNGRFMENTYNKYGRKARAAINNLY